METSTRHLLTGQVKEHLKALPVKDRVRELIYNHFLPQCNQYEIGEDEFYKEILKHAFREAEPAPEEDPDPANQRGTSVTLFGVTLHSLKRLGEVLFETPSRERIYFEDVTFLKAHTDQLADADAAITYTLLYKSEPDPEKRYLKVCYKLNPTLPYRIDQDLFDSLENLLSAGFESRSLMNKIYKDYGNGKLHIWLHAKNPDNFPPIPDDKTVISFLAFVYSINAAFPFYVEQELFYFPVELLVKAQRHLDFWTKLATYCNNGNLFVWFDALGHPEWRGKIKNTADLLEKEIISEEHKTYALVQQLLFLIDAEAIRPLAAASQAQIEKLNLAATEKMVIPIAIDLLTVGFVKPVIRLQNEFEGIELDNAQIVLFDLTCQKQAIVNLYVDPQKLDKNTEYQTVLQIISPYQTIDIPVRLKTVFPLRTFVFYLVKYSLFGAMFFGFFRWLLSAGTGRVRLAPQIITTAISRSLPDNYPIFYWVFITMLITFVISIVTIRKVEKI